MTNEEIVRIIKDSLAKITPEIDMSTVDTDCDLREELDIDSMDFFNFVVALNKKLGVEIPEKDYGKLMTIDDIVEYVNKSIPA